MPRFFVGLYHAQFFFLPAVIALAALDAALLAFWRKETYDWRAALASLADALGRDYVVYRFLPLSLAAPVIGFAWSHRLATLRFTGRRP